MYRWWKRIPQVLKIDITFNKVEKTFIRITKSRFRFMSEHFMVPKLVPLIFLELKCHFSLNEFK